MSIKPHVYGVCFSHENDTHDCLSSLSNVSMVGACVYSVSYSQKDVVL